MPDTSEQCYSEKEKGHFFLGRGLVKYHHFWKLPLMSCGNQKKTMPKKQCRALQKQKKRESERVVVFIVKKETCVDH